MDDHWSLEEERQELIDGIHYLDPGDDVYMERLKALKEVSSLIPKDDSLKNEIELKKIEAELKKIELETKRLEDNRKVELELRKAEADLAKADLELRRESDGNRVHWPKVIETVIPIVAGVVVTGLLEGFGLIFTSKGSFFWRK